MTSDPRFVSSERGFDSGAVSRSSLTSRTGKPPLRVYSPGKIVNPVFEELLRRGLVRRRTGPGKYEVTCPWCTGHEGELEPGAVYREPDEEHPAGSFRCLRGRCAGKGIDDLLGFLSLTREDASLKPRVCTIPGRVNQVVEAAEQELARTGRYFRRSGEVVSVSRRGAGNRLTLTPATQPSLMIELTRLADWCHYDGRRRKTVPCDPPLRYLAAILDNQDSSRLPELSGVSRQPFLRPDGSVRTTPGFDPENGVYGDFDPKEFAIPENPGKSDAEAACRELEAVLGEFPFEAPCDRSAAVSAMLCAAVRPRLPTAPMYHAKAHLPGSGKSYLASVIAAFGSPDAVPVVPFPKDEEECRKLLLSIFLEAPPVVVFDNLTEDIRAFKSLCIALTEPAMGGRLLGTNRSVDVSTKTLLLSTGNNVGPVADMTRRVVPICLAPKDEIPANHVFRRPGLLSDVRRERGRLVSAALTIVSAWIRAGRPISPAFPAINSFQEWSSLCREPLLWLGREDPAQRMFESMREDPERLFDNRMLTALRETFQNGPFTVKMIADRFAGSFDSGLRDALEDEFCSRGELNRRRIGWWLKSKVGTRVDGRKLVKSAPWQKQLAYRIELAGEERESPSFCGSR
ncbi:MAG: hypothetical protein PUG38_09220 [Sutterellaceae bacterium]|nr:hypothetical protein [Sutterellaceae bacterium]